MYIYMYIHTHVYACAYVYAYVCISVYVSVYMYMCICVYVYMCICVHCFAYLASVEWFTYDCRTPTAGTTGTTSTAPATCTCRLCRHWQRFFLHMYFRQPRPGRPQVPRACSRSFSCFGRASRPDLPSDETVTTSN